MVYSRTVIFQLLKKYKGIKIISWKFRITTFRCLQHYMSSTLMLLFIQHFKVSIQHFKQEHQPFNDLNTDNILLYILYIYTIVTV